MTYTNNKPLSLVNNGNNSKPGNDIIHSSSRRRKLLVVYLGFGTQTRPVRSLDTDTKAPSGKAAVARPLTSISCAGREQRSLYELLPDIITDERQRSLHALTQQHYTHCMTGEHSTE